MSNKRHRVDCTEGHSVPQNRTSLSSSISWYQKICLHTLHLLMGNLHPNVTASSESRKLSLSTFEANGHALPCRHPAAPALYLQPGRNPPLLSLSWFSNFCKKTEVVDLGKQKKKKKVSGNSILKLESNLYPYQDWCATRNIQTVSVMLRPALRVPCAKSLQKLFARNCDPLLSFVLSPGRCKLICLSSATNT